jgi:type I restriction enzyme S subunit
MNSDFLGDLVDIRGGGTPSRTNPNYWGGKIPWATVKDFSTTTMSDTMERITEQGVAESATNIIPAGNIILPTRMALGKAAINLVDIAINQDLKALLIKDGKRERVHKEYLFRFLLSKSSFLESSGKGATVKGIRLEVLRELEVPLPPLKEQKRIAAILDKADHIRRKRQQTIKLADEFLRAVFLNMFGVSIVNSNGWDVKPIGDLLANKPNAARTGPFGSQLKHSEFVGKGVPVLGIDNIVTNHFRWTIPRCLPPKKFERFKRYRVFPEDLIITIMGTTGRVAVAPSDLPECMSTKHLCVLTLNRNKIDPVYLWATLLFDNKARSQAEKYGSGAIMEGWNMGIIKAINVRVPPLHNQLKFRKVVECSKHLAVKLKTFQQRDTEQLFNSLTQRAFRGEL